MRRTTVMLPEELAALLDMERQRRNVSTAELIREALEAFLTGERERPRRLGFAALGRSGQHDTAREAEAILEREWGRDCGR